MKTLLSIVVFVLLALPSLKAQDDKNYWSQDKVNDFVLEAQSKNLMVAALSEIIQEKSNSQAVKDLARLEAQDHMNSENNLEKSVTVAIPVEMQSDELKEVEKLKEKSGKEVDQEFLDILNRYHKSSIDDYENAKDHLQEPSLRKWVTDQLPVAREHLNRVDDLKNRIR